MSRRGAAGRSRAAARARHGGERPAGAAAPRGGERPAAAGSSSPARRETGGPKNPGREEVVSRGERSRGGQIDVLIYDCEERRGAARWEQQPCAEGSGSQVRRETGGGAPPA